MNKTEFHEIVESVKHRIHQCKEPDVTATEITRLLEAHAEYMMDEFRKQMNESKPIYSSNYPYCSPESWNNAHHLSI